MPFFLLLSAPCVIWEFLTDDLLACRLGLADNVTPEQGAQGLEDAERSPDQGRKRCLDLYDES
jgi:hypothetical protein